MTKSTLMKDGLGDTAVHRIATALHWTLDGFPRARFVREATKGLEDLELKQRVHHLIDVLHRFLPDDFSTAADVLVQTKAHWDPGDPNDSLNGFAAWPLIDYIAVYGVDDPSVALPALKQLTTLFSAEFAIRPFILQHHDPTYAHLTEWCSDRDHQVRRLVSEGTRPRLPWGERLPPYIADPSPVLTLLERLKTDPSETVRRSVANNLNDISKDHPDLVIATCRKWGREKLPHGDKLIRHALRTLIKAGRPEVFPLLGYTASPGISISEFTVAPDSIRLGDAIEFTASLVSKGRSAQKMVVDYAVHHVKANGNTTRKVFKLKSLTLLPGESTQIIRRHTIRKITTRSYYPGLHTIELLINGTPKANASFTLHV